MKLGGSKWLVQVTSATEKQPSPPKKRMNTDHWEPKNISGLSNSLWIRPRKRWKENGKVRGQLATDCLALQVILDAQQRHLRSLGIQTIVLSNLSPISTRKVESWEPGRKKNCWLIGHFLSPGHIIDCLFSRFHENDPNLNAFLSKTQKSVYVCIPRLTTTGCSILGEILQKSCFPRNAHTRSLEFKRSVFSRLWADWHHLGPQIKEWGRSICLRNLS